MRSGLLLVVTLLVAGCGAPPAPSPPAPAPSAPGQPDAADPVQATVERDGVVLSLLLEADRVTAGEPVRARVRVANVGPGIVFWQGGGCDLMNGLSLDGPPLAAQPPGRDWPGVAGLVKWAATTGVQGHTGFAPPDLPDGTLFGCPADLRVNELASGASEEIEAVWLGITADTLPAPAGSYVARMSFPFLARQLAGPFPGDPLADRIPLDVEVAFEVEGVLPVGISANEAIDAALADARVAIWIETDLPRERVGGARIRLVDGAWRFEIDLSDPTGDTEAVATIRVDPADGRVDIVDLGPPAGGS